MAEQIDSFPAPSRNSRRYPWDEWTDGHPWKLYRLLDFDSSTDKFRNRMYAMAQRRGLKVDTHKAVETVAAQSPAAIEQLEAKGVGPEVEVLYIQFHDPSVEAEAEQDTPEPAAVA